jgi:hypothetical protein
MIEIRSLKMGEKWNLNDLEILGYEKFSSNEDEDEEEAAEMAFQEEYQVYGTKFGSYTIFHVERGSNIYCFVIEDY